MPENAGFSETVSTDALSVTDERPEKFEKADLVAPSGAIDIRITPEKPFNACLSCQYFRNGCSGPDLLLMTLERIFEFLRNVQILFKIPNAEISRNAGVSISSVRRIMSGQEKNPRLLTLQAIATYLVGDPNGKHPCALYITQADHHRAMRDNKAAQDALAARDEELAQTRLEIAQLERLLDQERAAHANDNEKHELLQTQRHDYLKRKDRYIVFACSMLALSMLLNVLLAALL